jgi:hypothetical protein
MAAISLTSKNVTEFAGDYKVAVVKVTATTSTNDTVTISDMGTIVGATASPAAATTADCALLSITGISTNVMTVQAMKAAGTICTQTPIAFYITAIGY